jgi:glycosyltransferase involved in cell wall biosynthesis
MMKAIEVIFWSATFLILYAYAGYPLLLWMMTLYQKRTVAKTEIKPSVSIIITAYNEEARIAEKIEETLKIRYEAVPLELLVASDCSNDGTDDIVRSYEGRGVRLIRAATRRGKEAAQRLAVDAAKGEILVFSDVATILPEDAVTNIVKSFADPTVGCVSSVDRFIDQDGRMSGEGAYVRYEMFLRSLECRVNSLVGLSGSFFAARASVCQQAWSDDLQSDFNTVLNCVRMGARGVADSESVGYYKDILDERKEFERKVRTVLRGISVFMKSLSLVNPFRYPLFAWQLVSHKLCRWLVPFGLIGALLSSAVLAWTQPLYKVMFAGQVLFYTLAIGGLFWKSLTRVSIVKLSTFFVMVNASILQAWWRYGVGERLVAWEPSRR